MIKKLKYLTLLMLIAIPVGVKANVPVGGQAPLFSVDGEQAYCITPGLQSPSSVSSVKKFGDSILDTAYLGAYRLSLVTEPSSWFPSDIKNNLIQSGFSPYLDNDAVLAQSLALVYHKLYGGNTAFTWPAYSTKLACGGLYAVGRDSLLQSCQALNLSTCAANSLLSYNDCRVQLSEYSAETLNWLKKPASSFIPKFVDDMSLIVRTAGEDKTKSDPTNMEFIFKLDGEEYENIKGLLSDSRFSALASSSKIDVYECEIVNQSDKAAGLGCSVNNQNMLSNNELRVKITNANSSNLSIQIKIKYKYDFPFNASGAKIYSLDGSYTQQLLVPFSSTPDLKEQIVTINLTGQTPPPVQECRTTTQDGKRIYYYKDAEISLKEYIDKCGCDSVPLEEIYKDEEVKRIYNESCGKNEVKKCEVKNVNNQKTYYNK